MEMLHSAVGGEVAITNPNYVPPIEEEDEEICPNCGEWWDGYYCECCGYDPDNEDECCDCDECDGECGHSCCECENEDGLSDKDIDRILETLGVPKALYDLVRQELGLL
jgi:hypothetical protein